MPSKVHQAQIQENRSTAAEDCTAINKLLANYCCDPATTYFSRADPADQQAAG